VAVCVPKRGETPESASVTAMPVRPSVAPTFATVTVNCTVNVPSRLLVTAPASRARPSAGAASAGVAPKQAKAMATDAKTRRSDVVRIFSGSGGPVTWRAL
jgi:hypothetical protein